MKVREQLRDFPRVNPRANSIGGQACDTYLSFPTLRRERQRMV